MRVALLLPVVLIAAACATHSLEPTAPTVDLLDTYWRVEQIDGYRLVRRPGTREPHIVLSREGSRVSGFAGCNNLSGAYLQVRDALSIENFLMTRMACGGEGDALEAAFTKALGSTSTYRIVANRLELRDVQGVTRMILEARRDATR